MSASPYDVLILGGGIGGYTAAIRAAQKGKTVAIVEKDKVGGTCLHRGCIPSKALLRSAEAYSTIQQSEKFGIFTESLSFDFSKVLKRKTEIVEQLYRGLQGLMKQYKIDMISGYGRIIGPSIFSPRSGAVAVEKETGEMETYVSEHLIIATGSRPRVPEGIHINGTSVITSDEALQMSSLPKSMAILGGGAIGLEWASLLRDFGVEVTLLENAERILPGEDKDVSKEVQRLFVQRGINILTKARLLVESVHASKGGVSFVYEHEGRKQELTVDKLLVCVGRKANIEQIGIENTDIEIDNGCIQVNESMQTSESHIYAVGNVIGGAQLAHAASYEAMIAVEHTSNQAAVSSGFQHIPRCIYIRPEVASVGLTEEQALQKGHDIGVSKSYFKANGKAVVYGEEDGFVKTIIDRQSQDILGVHMVGPHVTNAIAEVSLAQLLEATPWEIGQTIHPHPTFSELLGDVMWDAHYTSLKQYAVTKS